ncbi:hypothetical protein BTM25_25380 [Actinomadura rubteroloni]|uniref:Uncharacterized protein n=1 Tax=Actinomadura rubteroloni TaxID=1926885 RepID=A0A2P4UFU3_9ACTN|nr:hypothetical protein [Actinomadura rubteroloni]POM23912.1 hypothetical protein BTM25_25380 [Actinomadura rubteroloni]
MPRSGMPRVLALLAGLFVTLSVLVLAPAGARGDGPSLHVSPAHPNNREPVTVSGRFPGAGSGRDVRLEREAGMFGGEWEAAANVTTARDGSFRVLFTRLDSDDEFRAVLLSSRGRVVATSAVLKVSVAYRSVDHRWKRGDAGANRSALFDCFGDNPDCTSNDSAHMGPLWLMVIFVACFIAVAVLLVWIGVQIPQPAGGIVAVLAVGAWIPVFNNLAFGYALPRIGLEVNVIGATFLYPAYLLVLLLGVAVMIGYPLVAGGLIVSGMVPPGRALRFIVYAIVLGVLFGWKAIYDHSAAIAAGPFSIRTPWLHDALNTWALQWPVTALWEVLKFFASPDGLLLFAVIAAVSVALPDPGSPGGLTAGSLAQGAVANVAGLIVGTAVITIVSIIVFAVLVLAAVALMMYVFFYILVAFTTIAFLAFLFKR